MYNLPNELKYEIISNAPFNQQLQLFKEFKLETPRSFFKNLYKDVIEDISFMYLYYKNYVLGWLTQRFVTFDPKLFGIKHLLHTINYHQNIMKPDNNTYTYKKAMNFPDKERYLKCLRSEEFFLNLKFDEKYPNHNWGASCNDSDSDSDSDDDNDLGSDYSDND